MFFSIITPCFNSTKTLYRTFESLKKQTCRDFEWILVDDCSTDGGATRRLIEQIAKEADFPVKYHFSKVNNYVVKACSIGCEMAVGDYQIGLGHDDMCVPDALERAKNILLQYKDDEHIAGLAGRCINEKGKLHGKPFPKDFQIEHEVPFRYKTNNMSELFKFTKREIMLEYYKYAVRGIGGHKLINYKISKSYKYVFTNEVFRIYDTSVPGSIMKSKPKYPKAVTENILLILIEASPYIHLQPKLTFNSFSRVFYLMFQYNLTLDFKLIKKSWFLCLLFVPAFIRGFAIYLRRKKFK